MVHHTVHLLHSSISVDDELVRPMTDMDAGQSDRMPRGDLHSPASAIIFEYLKHSSTTYEKLDIVRKEVRPESLHNSTACAYQGV